MRRLMAWIGGVAGGIVAYRFWRRHQTDEDGAEPEVAADADTRAEQLRERLAESRAAEPVTEESAAEPAVEEQPADPVAEEHAPESAEPESIEERRRRVHEEGRATIEEMHPD